MGVFDLWERDEKPFRFDGPCDINLNSDVEKEVQRSSAGGPLLFL